MSYNSRDSILTYLKLAKNTKLTYLKRSYYNKKAYNLIARKDIDSLETEQLFLVAENFCNINDWDNLNSTSKFLLKDGLKKKDSFYIARASLTRGFYYTYTNHKDSALCYFLKAKKIFENKKNINIVACYLAIAEVQYSVNNYIGSEVAALKALQYSKLFEQKENEYLALSILANISHEMGDYDKTFYYNRKALDIIRSIDIAKEKYHIESCLNNLGYNYSKIGLYKESLKLYNEALKNIKRPVDYPQLYAKLIDNIAYSEFKLKQLHRLPKLYYDASRIRDSFNVDDGKNYNRLLLSEYYISIGDSTKGIQFAKEAYTLSKKANAPVDALTVLKYLSKINCKESSSYIKEYIKISDSLKLAERMTRNKFARIAYETEEIIQEKDTAIKQKWIILWIASGAILFAILLFVIKMQRSKQKDLLFAQQQQTANESIYQLIHDRQIKIDEGRQLEKKRIAQELHDGVMNRLASTRLNLFILNKKKDPETIEKCLGFINDIQNIEKEIRQVAHDLDNDIFSGSNSFNSILDTLVQEQQAISEARIFTEIDQVINWESIESIIKMNLYRILQEALQNSNKYAKAKNIYVTITKNAAQLHIVIMDDGIGFDTKKTKSGIGLKNMNDRIKILSGKIDIRSRKGNGTTIIVNLPSQTNK